MLNFKNFFDKQQKEIHDFFQINFNFIFVQLKSKSSEIYFSQSKINNLEKVT